MSSTMVNSKLFKDQFSTKDMRSIFSDENMVQQWINVESNLAMVEADLGIIPKASALEIFDKADVRLFDFQKIKEGIDKTWHPIITFINEYKNICQGDHGEYIHWGLTTQDVMDTGMMLQIKQGIHVIKKDLKTIHKNLCNLAEEHSKTVMAGRTHGQHALPITFGYKVAIWVSEIGRHLDRLEEINTRSLAGNISGAVGTLASLGDIGVEVQKELNEKIDLITPDIAWHVSRDRLADITSFLGMIGGSFGKIANEIIQLQKTELSELEEPFHMGKIGSSTMPQKRNPMICEAVVSLANLLRNEATHGFGTMVQEHERDMGVWQSEWEFIPSSFLYASAILQHMKEVLSNLIIYPKNMERNLFKTNGLIMAEKVMMELAQKIGRQKAHDVIYDIAMQAFENDDEFDVLLKENSTVKSILSSKEIESMLDPYSYIGITEKSINNVIKNNLTK